MNLILIKRGDGPGNVATPFAALLATNRRVARLRAGDTGAGAWIWWRPTGDDPGEGWLLVRWQGLDIDYGAVVKHVPLPDGSPTAFYHCDAAGPLGLCAGAVWWSPKRLPRWLLGDGGVLDVPPDRRAEMEDDYRWFAKRRP